MNSSSEFRQDLVSGDWVLIAPGRSSRKHNLKALTKKTKSVPIAKCPFEDLLQASAKPPLLQYGNDGKWRLAIIENKYPALTHHDSCPIPLTSGPYHHLAGDGRHEILITRDHRLNFSQLKPVAAGEVLRALAERARGFATDPCLEYVSIFQNYGARAGASQSHPHYQLLALPVVPPRMAHSLLGSRRYFSSHRTCGHCAMIEFERGYKQRIVYENQGAIALSPYAAKNRFELRVFPKKHLAFFERSSEDVLTAVAEALQATLQSLRKAIYDPPYNFFIHTGPIRRRAEYEHYHWHIEIFPAIMNYAGFEPGTGVIINETDPDEAATILKKAL